VYTVWQAYTVNKHKKKKTIGLVLFYIILFAILL